VTWAIGRVKRDGSPQLERLKRRLEQVYESSKREVEAGRYSVSGEGGSPCCDGKTVIG
jgi:hypothetical protein